MATHLWWFALAGATAIFVAMAAICWQAVNPTHISPVISLKTK